MVRRLGVHEDEVEVAFDLERVTREKKVVALTTTLDSTILSRTKGDENFQVTAIVKFVQPEPTADCAQTQAFVKEELAEVKVAVKVESQTREQEDDEIVEALNRYTAKLQSSLQIINSTDT